MKKKSLLLVILLLLVSAFTLAACKAGEKGETGDKGDKGVTGQAGAAGDKGPDGAKGEPGDAGQAGKDATKPEFLVDENGIQWRLEGEEEWKLLVSVEDLLGYSQKYTISFDANGGEKVDALTDQVYKTSAELPVAKKAGYTFVGWTDGESEPAMEYTLPAKDVKLTAVWGSTVTLSVTPLGASFDVSALTEGPSFKITAFNGITETFGEELGMTDAENLDDVVGKYWYRLCLKTINAEEGVFEIVDILDSGIAQPTEGFDYVIGVHSNCKDTESLDALKEQVVRAEDNAFMNQIVVIEGFDPDQEENPVDWTVKTYTGYEKSQTVVPVGEKFTLPTNAALEGKAFLGWTVDGKTLVAPGEVTPEGDVEYIPVHQYTLTYELNGGTGDATEDVNTAEKAASDLPEPTNGANVFAGWFFDEELENEAEARPIKATTLYAKWIVPTTVTYDLDGGMVAPVYDTVITSYNTTNWGTVDGKYYWPGIYPASRLSATGTYWWHIPVKETETAGVYEVLEIADSRPHLTTTADAMDFVIVIYGDCANPILDTLRKDSNLVGSYVVLGNFPEDLSSTSTKAAVSIKLFYSLADAKGENPVAVYTEETHELVTPVKDGYEFGGWYDGETKVTSIPAATEPTTLTLKAKWEGPYTGVTYVLDGGLFPAYDTEISSYNTTNWGAVDGKYYWPGIYPASRLSATGTYWYHIPVKETETAGVYQVLEVADSRPNLTTTADQMDFVIVVYPDCANADMKALATDPSLVGSYVVLGNLPADLSSSSTAAGVTIKLFYTLEAEEESFYEYYLEAKEALPAPYKPGYEFLGWYDGDTKVTALEAPAESSKMTLTAKWGLAVPELTVEEIQAQFLKDVNAAAIEAEIITEAVEAADFYSTYKYALVGSAEATFDPKGLLDGNEALNAKYKWLVEWIEAKNLASDGNGNKRIYGACDACGYTYTAYEGSPVLDKYSQQFMANDIHNFLNGTGESIHGGSASTYPAVDFTAATAYDGLLDAAYAVGFTVDPAE